MTNQKGKGTIDGKVDVNYQRYGILHGPKPTFYYYSTPPQRLMDIFYTFGYSRNERRLVRLAGDEIIKESACKSIADKLGVSKEYVRERKRHGTYSVHQKEGVFDDIAHYLITVIDYFNLGIRAKNYEKLRKNLDRRLSSDEFAVWKRKLRKLGEEYANRQLYEKGGFIRYSDLKHYLDEDKQGFNQFQKGDLDIQLIELAKRFKGRSLDTANLMKEFLENVPIAKIVKNFQDVLRQMDEYIKAKQLVDSYNIQPSV